MIQVVDTFQALYTRIKIKYKQYISLLLSVLIWTFYSRKVFETKWNKTLFIRRRQFYKKK